MSIGSIIPSIESLHGAGGYPTADVDRPSLPANPTRSVAPRIRRVASYNPRSCGLTSMPKETPRQTNIRRLSPNAKDRVLI